MQAKKPKTYAFRFKDGKVNCYASPSSTCKVSQLWELTEFTTFHDAELAQATQEINDILDEVKRSNKDSSRQLSLLQVKDRHFLAWTTGIVGPHDDDETIRKALRLKG